MDYLVCLFSLIDAVCFGDLNDIEIIKVVIGTLHFPGGSRCDIGQGCSLIRTSTYRPGNDNAYFSS